MFLCTTIRFPTPAFFFPDWADPILSGFSPYHVESLASLTSANINHTGIIVAFCSFPILSSWVSLIVILNILQPYLIYLSWFYFTYSLILENFLGLKLNVILLGFWSVFHPEIYHWLSKCQHHTIGFRHRCSFKSRILFPSSVLWLIGLWCSHLVYQFSLQYILNPVNMQVVEVSQYYNSDCLPDFLLHLNTFSFLVQKMYLFGYIG